MSYPWTIAAVFSNFTSVSGLFLPRAADNGVHFSLRDLSVREIETACKKFLKYADLVRSGEYSLMSVC